MEAEYVTKVVSPFFICSFVYFSLYKSMEPAVSANWLDLLSASNSGFCVYVLNFLSSTSRMEPVEDRVRRSTSFSMLVSSSLPPRKADKSPYFFSEALSVGAAEFNGVLVLSFLAWLCSVVTGFFTSGVGAGEKKKKYTIKSAAINVRPIAEFLSMSYNLKMSRFENFKNVVVDLYKT